MRSSEFIPENFYSVYDEHREYVRPVIGKKHRREFGRGIWNPCGFKPEMSVLEIGCGTGLFIEYLLGEGIEEVIGVDTDDKVLDFMPDRIKERVIVQDIHEFLSSLGEEKKFDRIVMIDVLEHFNPQEGVNLLEDLKPHLKDGGGVVVRVPNLASPWGAKWQFHDLTHKSHYSSGSLKQVGLKAGFNCQISGWRRGNPRKLYFEKILYGVLNRIITDPPDLWSSMMIGYFTRK